MPNRIEFALVLVYGLFGIFFAFRFLNNLYTKNVSKLQQHTVWLTHLPANDVDDGTRFELDKEQFNRVGKDLSRELSKFIVKRWEEECEDREFLSQKLDDRIVQEVYVVHSHESEDNLAGQAFAVLSKEVYVKPPRLAVFVFFVAIFGNFRKNILMFLAFSAN